jgi:hypothetical protein
MWRMDKIGMKFNDEYFVWAAVLAVVVFALVYSWNTSKEYFGTQCWGPETAISDATGYPDVQSFDSQREAYGKYLGDQLMSSGKCPGFSNGSDCVNAGRALGLSMERINAEKYKRDKRGSARNGCYDRCSIRSLFFVWP